MPDLIHDLDLDRCPHGNVDKPTLIMKAQINTTAIVGGDKRFWGFYGCARCGGVVTAWSKTESGSVIRMFPAPIDVDDAIPETAGEYLRQAIRSQSSPAGAVMLTASSVDAMLKAKNYKEGNLYPRINQAKEDHLITEEMATWAHEVRLEANDPRHADEEKPLPTPGDAARAIEFTQAFAQFLFVLPARVTRGRRSPSSATD